jgi:hypothetical protein
VHRARCSARGGASAELPQRRRMRRGTTRPLSRVKLLSGPVGLTNPSAATTVAPCPEIQRLDIVKMSGTLCLVRDANVAGRTTKMLSAVQAMRPASCGSDRGMCE